MSRFLIGSLPLLIFTCVLTRPTAAFAQTVSISGVVHDPSHAVLPGAQITLDGAGVHFTATSDSAGTYRLTVPSSGNYTLTA